MAHIDGRKGEVTLPDGRIVSRQRASQLKNPEAQRIRAARYRKSDKRKAVQHRYWLKKKAKS